MKLIRKKNFLDLNGKLLFEESGEWERLVEKYLFLRRVIYKNDRDKNVINGFLKYFNFSGFVIELWDLSFICEFKNKFNFCWGNKIIFW